MYDDAGTVRSVCVWSTVDERWSLDIVATAVDQRGQGHASRLVARLIQEAQALGASSLHAEVDIRNARMQSLLADLGAVLYPDAEAARVYAAFRLR